MMEVWILSFEKVWRKTMFEQNLFLMNSTANIRSILGISNINDNTEVRADRYPQYEVSENFVSIVFSSFEPRFISMLQHKINYYRIRQRFYIKFFLIHYDSIIIFYSKLAMKVISIQSNVSFNFSENFIRILLICMNSIH